MNSIRQTASYNLSVADKRLGGCCQWVLDAVRQTVEWFHQPLGFDSLTLLVGSLDLQDELDKVRGRAIIGMFGGLRSVSSFKPRLMTGAFVFLHKLLHVKASDRRRQ